MNSARHWVDGSVWGGRTVILGGTKDFDNRQAWIIHRLKEAIGEARNRISVQDIVTSSTVSKRLEDFYSATGPVKIIFFFQKMDAGRTGTDYAMVHSAIIPLCTATCLDLVYRAVRSQRKHDRSSCF